MAISVVGSTAPVTTTGAATVSWPVGHTTGDFALLIVASRDGQAITTPSGWTAAFTPISHTDAGAGTGNGTTQSVFYKFAASSSESGVTLNDPGTYTIASMVVYRGVDTTTPFATTPTSAQPASSTGASVVGPAHSATNSAPMFNVLVASRGEQGSSGAWNSGNAVSGMGGGTASVVREAAYDGGAYEGTLIIAHDASVTSGSSYTPTVTFNGTGTRSTSVISMITLLGVATSAIAGSTSSVLSATGSLYGTGALVTSTANTLSTAGALIGYGAMSGTAVLEIIGTGSLSGLANIAGSASMVLSATGTGQAVTDSLLSAYILLELTTSGTLTATGTMSASAGTTLNTSAVLEGYGRLIGTSANVLTTSAVLTPISNLLATTSAALTATGTLSSSFALGGNSFNVLSTSATLSGQGRLIGSTTCLLTTSASMLPRALIGGTTSAVLTTLATLRSVPNPAFAANFRNVWLAVYNTRQALLNKIMGVTKVSLDASSTAITSLTSAINNPATGLAAQAAAYTLLQSRVTATENTNVAQGISITGLSASLAGKADVSITNTLVARVTAIEGDFGYNLLLNPGLVLDARNWAVYIWNSASRPQWGHGRDYLGSSYQVAGTHNFGMAYAGTNATAGEFYSTVGDRFPIKPSTDYIFSASLAMVQLTSLDASVELYDSAGNFLTDGGTLYNTLLTYSGGTNRANWRPMFVAFTSHASAAYAALRVRAQTRAGGINPRAHIMEAMLEQQAPGQTTPTTFNLGNNASWAEWNLTFNINGFISGIQYASNGATANFKVDADNFEVLSSSTGRSLTWSNGHLWNKGTTYSVIIGQDMTPDEDVIFWIGPNPATPATASKADASMYILEDGSAVFRGSVNQSLLSGSALELGSTRIHTGGGRLAPFTIRDFAYKGNPASPATMTLTSSGYVNPDTGTGYDHKRFSRFKADVILECHMHGDGDGTTENIYLEVQYNGGSWVGIHSFTGINCDRRAGFSMIFRYTTLESWTDVAFRARTSNGRAMSLLFKVTIDNTQESSNTPGSYSGADASGGGGGAPPAPGGGGGGGDNEPPYCVDYDTMLPDGRYLREVLAGDLIECVDIRTGERSMQPLLGMTVGVEECYRVTTVHGEVVQSKSTPMDMRDGSIVRTPDLSGLDLLTHAHGFEPCSVTLVGERVVLKPDLGDRMFFAGVRADFAIATHNIRAKDIEP